MGLLTLNEFFFGHRKKSCRNIHCMLFFLELRMPILLGKRVTSSQNKYTRIFQIVRTRVRSELFKTFVSQ